MGLSASFPLPIASEPVVKFQSHLSESKDLKICHFLQVLWGKRRAARDAQLEPYQDQV